MVGGGVGKECYLSTKVISFFFLHKHMHMRMHSRTHLCRGVTVE